MKLPSVTTVFPAYNDAGTIPSMVICAMRTLPLITDDYEVVVVNDGSRDHTAEVLDELARLYPRHLRVIHHPQNRGYGGALRTGFMAAEKEWVFYTDGDAQYDAREMTRLADAWSAEVEAGRSVQVVNGYKISRSDPAYRTVIGRVYHHVVRLMFGFKLRDVDCDFRLIQRELFSKVQLESRSGTICLEMVKKFQDLGCRFVEVPVNHYHRAYGRSQFFNFRRVWRTGVDVLWLWMKLVVRKEHLQMASPSLTSAIGADSPTPAAAKDMGAREI